MAYVEYPKLNWMQILLLRLINLTSKKRKWCMKCGARKSMGTYFVENIAVEDFLCYRCINSKG